jgi:hypothetical protein
MLRDRLVASAIRLGYRDVMFHGRHAAFVLFMEIDPTQVDVNAHPAKLEVRFRDGRLVHDFLFRSVERVMRDTYAGAPGAAPPPTDADSLLPPASQVPMPSRGSPRDSLGAGRLVMWPAEGHSSFGLNVSEPPPRAYTHAAVARRARARRGRGRMSRGRWMGAWIAGRPSPTRRGGDGARLAPTSGRRFRHPLVGGRDWR